MSSASPFRLRHRIASARSAAHGRCDGEGGRGGPLLSSPSRSRPRFPTRRRPENTLPSNEDHFTHTGYDAAGNQTSSETPAGAVTTNVWDDEGLRSRVILPNGIISTTIYNGDGQLVERQHGAAGAVRLIWDGSDLLAETNAADVTQTLFTHSPCSGPISQRGAASEFLHYDGQGSTVNVTDIIELILQIIIYDPFGNIIYDQPSGSSSSSASLTESPYMWLAQSGLLYIWDLAESLYLRSVYNSEQWRDLNPQTGGSDGALYYYPGSTVKVVLLAKEAKGKCTLTRRLRVYKPECGYFKDIRGGMVGAFFGAFVDFAEPCGCCEFRQYVTKSHVRFRLRQSLESGIPIFQ